MFDPNQARTTLARLPFNIHLGVDVVEVSALRGICTLPDRAELKNHVATQHAGALFTVGEAASGACVLGVLQENYPAIVPLARGAHIEYRKPAKGVITATAKAEGDLDAVMATVQAEGRALLEVRVSLTDAQGGEVATMVVDWHLRKQG